jgi:hypothetical protein
MSTVTVNKGAQYERPDLAFKDLGGHYAFQDFELATNDSWTNTGSAAVDSAYGSALYLDAADEIEYAGLSELYKPTAGYGFGGKSRTQIVWGVADETRQDIGFVDSSIADPAEMIGFSIATSGATLTPAAVITCKFDDAVTDSSVILGTADLPVGFSVDGWHEYAVDVSVDANAMVTAKYFIDGFMVKSIKVSGVGGWATAGLVWAQTNLTASSTHDQAVDWISLGSNYRP